MPAKPSGKIKVSTVHVPQKNGDIYILERQSIYIPEKKYNKILSSRLIGKIPKGAENPVPTRPKRSAGSKVSSKPTKLSATRAHIGMMDIIDHAGKVSGIDDGIYAATDEGAAQKIISLARYLLATNGQSLPGILTWQYNHPLPYAQGLSENIYYSLFVQVGRDESLQQNFFLSRCRDLPKRSALAYDSTTISTYSENQIDARYGYNKAGDGLKTIKMLTLYSIDTRQPIAFTKQPGNLPDVTSVTNALKQLEALGLNGVELVTDNGYYSEDNLSEMLCAGYSFITLIKTNIKWVRKEIDAHMDDMNSIKTVCPFDPSLHGVSVMSMHTFSKERKYADRKNGIARGTVETFERRVYINIYFSLSKQAEDRTAFEVDLYELKTLIESGMPLEELSEASQRKACKYLIIKKWGKKISVTSNTKACEDAFRYHGYFVLIANKEKDPFECLRKYRKRETIESFFQAEKQRADGARPRVWNADTLRGRMFLQFVALCYYEYLNDKVRILKQELSDPANNQHKSSVERDLESRLLSWLKNTPLYLQLQWFDTVDGVNVSSELKVKRWSTEITERDQLYLDRLGVKIGSGF